LARSVEVTDNPVGKGHLVNLDYSGAVDGEKFDGGTAENQELTLGSGQFIPGFEEQVEGMTVGQDKNVLVKFPEAYHANDLAGKDAVFAVHLNAIKFKELAEPDDEFAKDVSEFETLSEYKESIRAKLTEAAEKKARFEEDDKLIEAIAEKTEIEIPASMLAEEGERMIGELKMRMHYSGMKFEDFLKYTNQTEEEVKLSRIEEAKKSVKVRLILESIIKKEEIKPEKEDIEAEIEKLAKDSGKEIDVLRKSLKENDFNRMMNKILADKLFDFLRANNTIA